NVNIDKTAPTISGSPDRAANGNNWYNADVTVSFSGSDALSGLASLSSPSTLGEGANQSLTGTATDKAGNSATFSFSNINIDKTAPNTSGPPDRAANSSNWYNAYVTVSFGRSDALSGLLSVSGPTTLGEGAGQSVTGSATDKAGNSATFSVSNVNIDETAP